MNSIPHEMQTAKYWNVGTGFDYPALYWAFKYFRSSDPVEMCEDISLLIDYLEAHGDEFSKWCMGPLKEGLKIARAGMFGPKRDFYGLYSVLASFPDLEPDLTRERVEAWGAKNLVLSRKRMAAGK